MNRWLAAMMTMLLILAAADCAAEDPLKIFLINLANNQQLRATEYHLNDKHGSISFKSSSTGIIATLPADRIVSIEEASLPADQAPALENIRKSTIYRNEKSVAAVVDDGGIPANFYVVVGGKGGKTATKTSSRTGVKTGASTTSSSSRKATAASAQGQSSPAKQSGFESGTRLPSRAASSSSASQFSGASDAAAVNAFMDIFK